MQQKRKKTGGRGKVQAYSRLSETTPAGGCIENDCLRYRHIQGYPYPRNPDSCRGCEYSYDPRYYDSGCKHPQGPLPRNQREAEGEGPPGSAPG